MQFHLFVSCLCHLSVVSLVYLCACGKTTGQARGHPLTRDFNLSFSSSILPFTPQVHVPPLTPFLGLYIYFLLSVFSVCTIPWGCDRGEGAGHVGITSVYVLPASPPHSWAPAPSSRPPPLRAVLSSLLSQTPPFFVDHTPSPKEPHPLCCVLFVPHMCPGGGRGAESCPTPPFPLSLL